MSLRLFDIKSELMTAQSSHKWAKVFVKRDYEEFSNDCHGSKQTDSFMTRFLRLKQILKHSLFKV
jgi:hypothetical protein